MLCFQEYESKKKKSIRDSLPLDRSKKTKKEIDKLMSEAKRDAGKKKLKESQQKIKLVEKKLAAMTKDLTVVMKELKRRKR